MMIRHTVRIAVVALVATTLTACFSTSTKKGTVGVERKQMLLVSSSEMNQGAEQAYAQVLGESKKAGTLNTNHTNLKRIRTVADRLIPHTKVYRSDAPDWKWEVNLIDSKELNAWCMPGGKIAFYSGIIDTLKLTDDEIAAIMGHEIAHALREHGRERASQMAVTQTGLSVLGTLTGMGDLGMNISGMVMQTTFILPNSRTHETEADRMGVELAARAGYNPSAAIRVWQKMAKLSGGSAPPEILSTHPSNESRIEDLKVYSKKVEPLYQKTAS